MTRVPRAVWSRSPSASGVPSVVLSLRNPWTSPSVKRTGIGSLLAVIVQIRTPQTKDATVNEM